jgi:hypothetical protein
MQPFLSKEGGVVVLTGWRDAKTASFWLLYCQEREKVSKR